MPGKSSSYNLDQEIIDFYTHSDESERLKYGLGPLEFERNQELISRYLPAGKAVILDVGGGPGIYAEWMAAMGHEVFLIDPIGKHIEQARKRAKSPQLEFQCQLGEARKLDFSDNFADLVILHGPLYHLQEESDRIQALKEAKRVLKPGGLVLAFAITHAASTLVGLIQGLLNQEEIYEMCIKELSSGIHEAPASMPGVLAKGFYHRPDQFQAEITTAGLDFQHILPVEGMIWFDKNYFENRAKPAQKMKMMQLLRQTENDPSLLSLSPHIMGVAFKKT